MSRSKPSTHLAHPCDRWFEVAGGDGYIKYFDKDKDESINVGTTFQFLLLDELATIGGFHEPSESGIYSNEVRDTRSDPFLVRTFGGLTLGHGLYQTIREKIAIAGAKYTASCYLAYKHEDGTLHLGNIRFKGASLAAWSNFKRDCPVVNIDGQRVNGYFADAVRIDGFKHGKKGRVEFYTPQFRTVSIPPAVNELANKLDEQLQDYLGAYLARPVSAESETDAETADAATAA
jgi:hypothetical protein